MLLWPQVNRHFQQTGYKKGPAIVLKQSNNYYYSKFGMSDLVIY